MRTMAPPTPSAAPPPGVMLTPVVPVAPSAASSRPIAVLDRELRRFTVAEYQRMFEVGVLTDDDRTELLDGYLVFRDAMSNPAMPARLINVMSNCEP